MIMCAGFGSRMLDLTKNKDRLPLPRYPLNRHLLVHKDPEDILLI